MEHAVPEELQNDQQPADSTVAVVEGVQRLELVVGESGANDDGQL